MICRSDIAALLARFLPENFRIFAYARSKLSSEELRESLRSYLKGETSVVDKFLALISYIQGMLLTEFSHSHLHSGKAASTSD